MFRKILTIVFVIPLAAVFIAFAVANRQMVTVSFDPFNAAHPAYAKTLPLFVLVFVLVILGVIVGGVATWLRQGSWRRSARKLDADVRHLHQELAAMRGRYATERQPAPAAAPAALTAIPPPVS